jgi:hypothetical protein
LVLADKNAEKQKVWKAQSTGISSTSLGDKVLAHTASESTRLV